MERLRANTAYACSCAVTGIAVATHYLSSRVASSAEALNGTDLAVGSALGVMTSVGICGVMWLIKLALERNRSPLTREREEALEERQYDQLVNRVHEMPVAIQRTFYEQGGRLINDRMNRADRIRVFSSLLKLDPNAMESVTTQALRLIDENMQSLGRVRILQALGAVSPERREALTTQTLKFKTANMNGLSVARILGALSHVALENWAAFEIQTARLISDEMNDSARANLITLLAELDPREWEERIDRALAQLAIDGLGWENPQYRMARMEQLLNTPLESPFPQIEIGEVPTAPLGAPPDDAHYSNRDRNTRSALEKLREIQANVDQETLAIATREFIGYLEGSADFAQALSALRDPRRDGEEFGPLLGDDRFSILGLPISGEEAVGRIWLYTRSIADPEDRINAQYAMMMALSRSFHLDGTRVCNPGKVQQLVVAVLQGRLAGVEIEDEMAPAEISRISATLFFQYPAHRLIDNLPELLEAGERFCTANPACNNRECRAALRRALEAYGAHL